MTADDWVKIIGALASATVLILGAVGVLYAKVAELHRDVNGRMTDLLQITRSSARAEGRLERDAA